MTSENPLTTEQIKQKLGGVTEQFESKFEPWQRGLLLIALTLFLLFAVYSLTRKEKPKPRELTDQEKKEIEKLAEERILRRAEFLKRLRE